MKKLLLILLLLLPSSALADETIQFWDGSATFNLAASDSVGKTTGTVVSLMAHQFTPSSNWNNAVITLPTAKTGTPSDNMNVYIYADTAGSPSGSALATATMVAGGTVTTSCATYTAAAITYSFVSGTAYWAVMGRSGSTSDTDYYWNCISTPGNFGTHWAFYGGAWHNYATQFQGNIVLSTVVAATPTPILGLVWSFWIN